MSLPNKEDGITPGLLFAVSDPNNTTYDLLDPPDTAFGGLTERLSWRDQTNVTGFLKSRVKGMQGWQQSTSDVWGTALRRGAPDAPVSLMHAQTEAIARQLLPVDVATEYPAIENALEAFATAGNTLWEFLGNLNPFDPGFNIPDATDSFINLMLLPRNLIAALIDGFIPGANIPILDASKIGTGYFSQDRVLDLITDLAEKMGITLFNKKVQAGTNLILDPAITLTEVWGSVGTGVVFVTGEQAHSGTTSLRITADGSTARTIHLTRDGNGNPMPIVTHPGERFTAEAWVRPSSAGSYAGTVALWAELSDSTGVTAATTVQFTTGATATHSLTLASGNAAAWTKLYGTLAIPSGYDRITPYLSSSAAVPAGNIIHADDPVVREETAAQDLLDQMTQALLGDNSLVGIYLDQARAAWDKLMQDVRANTNTIQELRSAATSRNYGGKDIQINFSDYPDGAMPSIFTISYTGGTSRLGITAGEAHWRTLNNEANTTALLRYNVEPMDTDFVMLHGTMTAAPQEDGGGGAPQYWATWRHSVDDQNFGWVKARNIGWLLFRADIGCRKAGVDYTWVSNIPLSWSLNMYIVVGVGVNARSYEVWSGDNLVQSYTETAGQPGGLSVLGSEQATPANYRYWGSIAEMKTNVWGAQGRHSGAIGHVSVNDNAPPDFVGPIGHMYRTSTTGVLLPGNASGWTVLASNFFGVTLKKSQDITASLANGSFTVTKEGSYTINGRIMFNAAYGAIIKIGLFINGTVVQARSAQSYPNDAGGLCMEGTFTEYLVAGDVVQLGTRSNGLAVSNGLVGEATGTESYFNISATNLSYS